MNIPNIIINAAGCCGDLNINIQDSIADDLLNYIRHSISNKFMGSVSNGTTMRAMQMFISGELLALVHSGRIRKDHTNTWIIEDYRGLWV